MSEPFDCIVIGAGPAGLAAAVYLGRFRRRVLVLDDGASRASLIPWTRNLAGFPDGISGVELLQRMRAHAERFGAKIRSERALHIERAAAFAVNTEAGRYESDAVLLATGVQDVFPPLAGLHQAIAAGVLRLCPICDAYEAMDRRIAVLGSGEAAVHKAIFLSRYSPHVTLLDQGSGLACETADQLAHHGIALEVVQTKDVRLSDDSVSVSLGNRTLEFDILYPALGSRVRSELAGQLGADRTDDGCILVDAHQQTSLQGILAAGDVVAALDQISVAVGHAAIAATTIHNRLLAAQTGRG